MCLRLRLREHKRLGHVLEKNHGFDFSVGSLAFAYSLHNPLLESFSTPPRPNYTCLLYHTYHNYN